MDDVSTDQILSELSKGSDQAQASPASPDQSSQATQPAVTPEMYEYTIQGGQTIKEPLDMLKKRAGMGYHYAQEMHRLNQRWEQVKGIEERNKALSRWEDYDKYARENPEWARHVEESWNNRSNLLKSNQETNPEFESLKKSVSEQAKFLDELKAARSQERVQLEDKQFGQEIDKVGKDYGVDLTQSDEYGRSLEWRVLEHMKKLGLDGSKAGHFSAAFRDYYFDNLVGLQKSREKEANIKSQVELNKAGIREVSRIPKQPDNLKTPSAHLGWNELAEMAKQELASKRA